MRPIDADALIADIKECIEIKDSNFEWEQTKGLKVALSCIDEAQTVQPGIIHCKDCKWSDWYDVDGYKYCYCIETGVSGRTADDFCSYAERETK